MNAPAITRHRRPFLAPIWIAALLALAVGTALFVGVRLAAYYLTDVSTVIVLRHAEKASFPADDPPLAAEGRARAERLAAMLGGPSDAGPVRHVYSSEARRARDTAAPLAARLGVEVETVAGGDVDALVRAVRRDARGETSVVVGHGDTVPQIVAELADGRLQVTLDEGDHGSMFVVTVSSFGPPRVLRLRY
ncbi:MAG: histidine phosphatase family protein [Steroidobacteraceae bacterium]|jgi:broad specificity phosphatase PhoE|nr:histidine phosphatase family protein [Steroidobacteraceae bacterium]